MDIVAAPVFGPALATVGPNLERADFPDGKFGDFLYKAWYRFGRGNTAFMWPGVGALRSPAGLLKPGQFSDDLVKAAQQKYPNKAGKIEYHHVEPKYLGGASKGTTVPINAAYHQMITNEFRSLWPYGKGIPSPAQLNEILMNVYSKYPLPGN